MLKRFLIQSNGEKQYITLDVAKITKIKEVQVSKCKWFLGFIPYGRKSLLKTIIYYKGFFRRRCFGFGEDWVDDGKIVLDCNMETALDILEIPHNTWEERTIKSDLKYGQHD